MMSKSENHDVVFDGKRAVWTQRDWQETIDLMMDYKNHHSNRSKYFCSDYRSPHILYRGFHGVNNYDETIDLVKNGDRKQATKLKATIEDVIQLPAMKDVFDEIRGYGVCGYEFEVPRFLTGDPEYFITEDSNEMSGPKKVISVVLTVNYSQNWKPHQIRNRGAALCALVDALEKSGRDVELIAAGYFVSNNDDIPTRLRYVTKKAGEQFDLSRTAFALSHPAMFRQVMFVEMERKHLVQGTTEEHYPNKGRHNGEYGYPSTQERENEPDTCFIAFPEGENPSDSCTKYDTIESAMTNVKSQLFDELKRIGVL